MVRRGGDEGGQHWSGDGPVDGVSGWGGGMGVVCVPPDKFRSSFVLI